LPSWGTESVRRPRIIVKGAGCRVQGAGCRVQGAGCRVQGAGCRVQGAGCRVQGAGCRVLRAGGPSRWVAPVSGFRMKGDHAGLFVGVFQKSIFNRVCQLLAKMPTQWLQERVNGSKYGSGMPPHRAFCGGRLVKGGGTVLIRCRSSRVQGSPHRSDRCVPHKKVQHGISYAGG
jgi:hypothetical protein